MTRYHQPKDEPEAQLDMISEGILGDGFTDPAMAKDEKCIKWTGDQVKRWKPKIYAQAVKLLAAGLGTVDIADLLHISTHTVQRIRDGDSSLAIEKERLARLMGKNARLAAEGIAEDLGDPDKAAKISTAQKAMIAGIMTDKMQVLSGGPTSVVQTFNANLDANEWAEAMGSGVGNKGGVKADGASTLGRGDAMAASEGAGQGDAAPKVYKPRESHDSEVVDVPAN